MIKNGDKERLIGLMADNISDSGTMENNMARVYFNQKLKNQSGVNGKMVKGLSGLKNNDITLQL